MKLILFIIGLIPCFLFAQLEDFRTQSGTPCYQKAAAKMQSKYFEFDCGKVLGVVDCNEKLEYEEQVNTFYSKGSGALFTGTCETCHSNGVLEHRIHFVNGKEEGIDTTYYRSGCPMVIRENTMGIENGTWRFFYDSTQQIAWIKNYFRGLKQGIHVYFDNKGDTTIFENYVGDLLNGVRKVYFTQNKVERIIHYKDGVFNGSYRTFGLDGNKTSDLNYKMGKKNGVLTYFYDDGTLMKTENWTNGIQNGEFKTLYYNGNIQKLENYKKGIKEGLFEEWYNNNKLKRRAIYKKGGVLEDHHFDEDGNETYTYGAQPYSGKEDDDLPEVGTKKKKKKKKK